MRQQQRLLRAAVEPRIVERLGDTRRRVTIDAAKLSISDHAGSALLVAGEARTPPPRTVGRSSRVLPSRFAYSSCRIVASRSACAFASTSRFRILAAPATARSATWSRSCSRAAAYSCCALCLGRRDDPLGSASASTFAASIVSDLNFSPWRRSRQPWPSLRRSCRRSASPPIRDSAGPARRRRGRRRSASAASRPRASAAATRTWP